MSATEFEKILGRVAALERHAKLSVRSGIVIDVDLKKGVLIDWGKERGGDKFKSPWVKHSAHHGFVTEHKPYKVGQTVVSIGMDPEHQTALLFPHSPSTRNPQDKDAALDKHTYRIRDPKLKQQQSGQQQQANGAIAASGSGGSQQAQQPAKDDPDDLQHTRSYKLFSSRMGKALSHIIDRAKKSIVSTANEDKEPHVHSVHSDDGILSAVSNLLHSTKWIPGAKGGITHAVDSAKNIISMLAGVGSTISSDSGKHKSTWTQGSGGGIMHAADNGKHVLKLVAGAFLTSDVVTNITAPLTNVNSAVTNLLGKTNVSGLLAALGGAKFGANSFTISPDGKMSGALLEDHPNDAAAEAAGVAVGQFYRNGSVLMARVT